MAKIRRKEPHAIMNKSECKKKAHFNIVSTTLVIGLNIKFLVRNLRKVACISIPLYSIQLP